MAHSVECAIETLHRCENKPKKNPTKTLPTCERCQALLMLAPLLLFLKAAAAAAAAAVIIIS